MVRPEVTREIASAMWMPDALLPHHHGADIGIGGVLDEMIDRIAAENFDSLALHDFRNGGAEFHADLSPKLADVGLGLSG